MTERFAELDYIDGYHYTHWKELPAGTVVRVEDVLVLVEQLTAALDVALDRDDAGYGEPREFIVAAAEYALSDLRDCIAFELPRMAAGHE